MGLRLDERNVEIKVLLLKDFGADYKARDDLDVRIQHAHPCFYKIVFGKTAIYYHRYVDEWVANMIEQQPAEGQKWLIDHLGDKINQMLDSVTLA
jgi:hypothetical protein